MIVRGTTETRDELTGNFGSALEDTSISDYRLIALFAEKTLNAIFGVLQHYPPRQRTWSAYPVLWNVGVCFSFDFVAKAFFG